MPPQDIWSYYDPNKTWDVFGGRVGNSDWMRLGYDDAAKMAFDIGMAQYQNEFNAYQAELAFNRQKELINAQNEYNSPKNQLARYMQAGLNPSMIYGQISPGLQTQTASYQPQKAANVENHMPGTTEKLDRAMSVISTIGNLFSTVAGVASQFEGVKNQNLQNQILEARLPAEQMSAMYETALSGGRYTWLNYPNNWTDTGPSEQLLNVLFPDIYRGEASGAKADYQKWWNETIAPIYKTWFEGRTTAQSATGEINKYNQEMLESLPPAVRPLFGMLMQILGLIGR